MEVYPEVRSPAVAGYFYPIDPRDLRGAIEDSFKHQIGPGILPKPSPTRIKESTGFVVPHAGYIYSGPVAAHSYLKIAEEGLPETFIIIGPNHTGYGALVSVYPSGKWATPLGKIEIDTELARSIVNNSEYAELDVYAHVEEHSVEVQLPFLQYIFGNKFKLVPIVLALQTPEVAVDLANAIYDAIAHSERDIVIIASTDFTHYEPHEKAKSKDLSAIEEIIKMDLNGFYRKIKELNISICGPGGIMVLIEYTRKIYGNKAKAELLKYATSGDTSGNKVAVVGYASIRFYGK